MMRFALLCVVLSALLANGVAQAQCCAMCMVDIPSGCYECWTIGLGGFMCHAGPGCYDCTNTWECDGGGGGCFLGGVAIATPSGPVPIADLAIGDAILSMADSGEIVVETVVNTQVVEAYSYLRINERICVTGEHPFRVGQEWVLAKDLVEGNVMSGQRGGVRVGSIVAVHQGVRAHNITTSGNHTFIAEGVVVHNKVTPIDP